MVLPITFPTRARLFPPHCFHCFLSADKSHWHCWQPWTNHCHWPKRATSWSISSNLIFMWVGQWFFTRRSSEIECRAQLVYFSLTKIKMFMKLQGRFKTLFALTMLSWFRFWEGRMSTGWSIGNQFDREQGTRSHHKEIWIKPRANLLL